MNNAGAGTRCRTAAMVVTTTRGPAASPPDSSVSALTRAARMSGRGEIRS